MTMSRFGFDSALLLSLAAALGLGLLIGLVRERRLPEPAVVAGLRTHALAALGGVVALWIGSAAFVVLLLTAGLMAALSYYRSRDDDPGLTGEFGLVITVLLGGLALGAPALASALGVVVAALLYAKASLHRLSRELISERELRDGLFLLASAMVILPLIPDRTMGPFDAFNPRTLWKLVVLVMATSALGHVALRAAGNRWGMAIAGFFAGYVSSTAATAGFGQRVRETPALLSSAVGATMFANLASITLIVPILLTVAPALLAQLWLELLSACVVLAVGGALGVHRGDDGDVPAPTAKSRMFRFRQAMLFAVVVTGVLLISAALEAWLGPRGAIVAAILAALAELHAAVATLGNLADRQAIDIGQARWALLGLLAASAGAKTVVAFGAGGVRYGWRVGAGLLAMVVAVALVQVPGLGSRAG